METQQILINANSVKTKLALLSTQEKNKALFSMADSLINNTEKILIKNKILLIILKKI